NGTAPTTNLYILWGGGNDLRNVFFPANDSIQGMNNLTLITKAEVIQAAQDAVLSIESEIDNLIHHGAEQFLWPNLPPLNLTHRFLAVDNMKVGDGTTIGDDLAAAVQAFDTAEDAAIKSLVGQYAVQIAKLDDYTAVNTIITNVKNNPRAGYQGY